MGVYLSTPQTEKVSEDGENDKLKFGLSSMQGWRATMEDAHSALLDLDNDTAFFGVFYGHGGKFSIVKPMQLVTWVLLSTELTSEWMK
ncbi:unnamed protein product [Miscanthus lutarioriparius]|uniref:protein-serine/threonine phosphatase n=1 Tax=Miscanthus lutarioriparius TaxID=422564 RepID=A0A811SJC7_9POAL|nr:unnamed protein product [Miscanthus lutarioriparius]